MDLAKKFDDLGRAFEEFKKTNDQRIDEIKKLGAAKPETETKLAKIEADMQASETKIAELNAALNRTGGRSGDFEDIGLKSYAEKLNQATGRVWSKDDTKKMRDYGQAVNQYMRKGTEVPAELKQFATKAMSEDSETGGGFLVVPEISAEIVKQVQESSPMRALADVATISSSSLKINQDLDRPASGWVGERGSRSATTPPTVRQVEIQAQEMYAYPEATQTFLDDAAVNVEAWLTQFCATAFAFDEATAFITGDGNQKPRGILGYSDGSVFGYIQRQACGGTGSITGDDLINMQQLLKEPYQKNAQWMIKRQLLGTIRTIKDGQGRYIWQPGLLPAMPNTLLDKPVNMAYDLNSALTTGVDGLAAYGDFKAGYQIVDRVGIRVLRDPYTNKPNVGFYTTKRVGGGVKNFEAIKLLKQP
jgi:HK97 family phage major capsid protein